MDFITNLIGGYIETFLILLIGFYFIGLKVKNNFAVFSVVSLYGSTLLIMTKKTLPTWGYLLILILSISILFTLIFNINVLYSFFAMLMGSLCLLISEAISFSVITLISYYLPIKKEWLLQSHPIVKAIPHWIIVAVTYFILSKKNINFVRNHHSKKFLSNLLFISLLGMMALYFIGLYGGHTRYFLGLAAVGVMIGSTLGISYLFKVMLDQNSDRISRAVDVQFEEEVSNYISLVKSQRHDFVHHLLAIHGMLSKGNIEECKNYLQEVLNEASLLGEILPLKSKAVSGLLLAYKKKAEKKGISVHYLIFDSLADIPCKTFEMNQILGNLIQNAIEEAEKNTVKEITVVIQRKGKFIHIEISNYGNVKLFERNIEKIFEHGFSTKDPKKNSGIGLANVNEILQRYNGKLFPEIRGDIITFNLILPIKGERISQ